MICRGVFNMRKLHSFGFSKDAAERSAAREDD